MKANDLSERLKSESELKRLEKEGVNVDSLRKSIKQKENVPSTGVTK